MAQIVYDERGLPIGLIAYGSIQIEHVDDTHEVWLVSQWYGRAIVLYRGTREACISKVKRLITSEEVSKMVRVLHNVEGLPIVLLRSALVEVHESVDDYEVWITTPMGTQTVYRGTRAACIAKAEAIAAEGDEN